MSKGSISDSGKIDPVLLVDEGFRELLVSLSADISLLSDKVSHLDYESFWWSF